MLALKATGKYYGSTKKSYACATFLLLITINHESVFIIFKSNYFMNSLVLLAMTGLLVFIALLWIFRKRKIVLFILFLAAGVIGWYGYGEYSRSHKDLINAKAKYNISATELLHEFEARDSSITNKKYDDQVLEISGNVKEIKNNNQSDYTVLLGDSNNISSVQC